MVSATDSIRQAQRIQQQTESRQNSITYPQNALQLGAITYAPTTREMDTKIPKYDSSSWTQFKILCNRMILQKFRDPVSKDLAKACSGSFRVVLRTYHCLKTNSFKP